MEIEMAKKPARNMKTIYVPADVDIYELIEQAAAALASQGYEVTKPATKKEDDGSTTQFEKINDSAVVITALQHIIKTAPKH